MELPEVKQSPRRLLAVLALSVAETAKCAQGLRKRVCACVRLRARVPVWWVAPCARAYVTYVRVRPGVRV